MFPRVLLSLNVLDEFGFRPGTDPDNYYLGNPEYAHYPLYEDLLNDYGLSEKDRRVSTFKNCRSGKKFSRIIL